MTLRRSLPWLLAVALLLSVLGRSASRPPVVEPGLQVAKSGVVLDAQTRQPLPGAYVVARWIEQSQTPTGSVAGQCLYRTIVRTDENGHYAIPATSFPIAVERTFVDRRYLWDAYAYTPGYTATLRTRHPRATGSVAPAVQELEPLLLATDHARPEQRVGELADSLQRFACEPYSRELGPVAEQIYAEAYTAACLPEPNSASNALARLRGDRPGTQPCAQVRQASTSPRGTAE